MKRQRLAPVRIETRSRQARRGAESDILKVPQERVHGRRPWTCIPDYDVAPAVHHRTAAAFKRRAVLRCSHVSLSC
jgi:hypothetical protein